MKSILRGVAVALAGAALAFPTGAQALTTFNDSGPDVASITDTVNAFRAALGNPDNLNAPGPLATGRREINWDGGGATAGTVAVTPFMVFTNTRGATFTTPGTGLTQIPVSGAPNGIDLAAINAQYSTLFAPFSPLRLFTPIGSNITEGFFTIPGTNGGVPAGVSGFGVVFSDVDQNGPTTIELGGTLGQTLGPFAVQSFAGNQTFSFLGILLGPGEGLISSVSITTGTTALGGLEIPGVDLVVMDDFLYGEPQQVPQPRSLLFLGLGLVAVSALTWVSRSRFSS
jgi:hypothetical protein